MKCGEDMEGIREALKMAITNLRCPLQVIAEKAGVSRSTVHYLLHGQAGMKYNTLKLISISVLEQLDRERRETEERLKEIDRMVEDIKKSFTDSIEEGVRK